MGAARCHRSVVPNRKSSVKPNHPEPDFAEIGRRVRAQRRLLGWSTQELALKAGLARYTVIRIEEGKPCKPESLFKLRKALHMFRDQLMFPKPESNRFSVHRSRRTQWSVSRSKSEYQRQAIDEDPSHVNDEAERHRLGALGFQPFYTAVLESELVGGLLGQALMEFHQPSWVDSHFGEEFVYCLRGRMKLIVGGDACELDAGDCMTFQGDLPHQYIPLQFDEQGRAPQILVVVALRPRDKQLLRTYNWPVKPAEPPPSSPDESGG